MATREIQASEAQTHLSRGAEIASAIDGLKALRRRAGTLAVEDILAARHEGYKY